MKRKLINKFIFLLIILLIIHSLPSYAIDKIRFSNKENPLKTASLPPRIVEDTIIVKFKTPVTSQIIEKLNKRLPSGIPSLDRIREKFKVERFWKQFKKSKKVDLSRIYKVKFPPEFKPEEIVKEFSKNPNVEYAQTIGIHPVYYTLPDDTYYSNQWALSQKDDHDVDAPKAWDINQGSESVILAIVDTGVDWRHPDLGGSGPDYTDGNIWINWDEYNGTEGVDDDGNGYIDDIRGWDWVDGIKDKDLWPGEDGNTEDNDPSDFNGHGTHCSGIASAITNNGAGVAGLAFSDKIMALRAGWSGPYRVGGDVYEVGWLRMDFCAEAIIYATDMEATAINCSWGSSNSGGLAEAVDYAIENGVLIVVAAGNDDVTTQDYLAGRGDCIDVASTDSNDKKSSFSNYGAWVDISAPGSSILSTYFDHYASEPDNHTYASLGGTSMSAPYVVGLIGLIKAYQPNLTADDIKTIIYNSADNIDSLNSGYEGLLGAGRINAFRALNTYANVADGTGLVSAVPGSVPTGISVNLTFTLTAEATIPITDWELTVPSGWSWSQSATDIVNLTNGCSGASISVNGNVITLSGCNIDKDGTFTKGSFTINNLTSPSGSGTYTFSTRTADNNGPLKAIEPIDEAKVVVSPVMTLPWSDDMETEGSSANGEWSTETNTSTNWELGAPSRVNAGPTSAHSGTQVWGTDLDLDYTNLTDAHLTTPYLDLQNVSSPAELIFYHYLDAEGTSALWDGGIIEITTDDGQTWIQIPGAALEPSYDGILSADWDNPLGGKQAYAYDTGSWVQITGDLDAYLGNLIKVRFRFGSDGYADTSDGWFIDDISLTATITDTTSPAAITDLAATAGTYPGEVNLSWTAPGDDGNTSNIVGGKYRIQYSTDANEIWDKDNYDIEWSTDTSPGASQAKTITDLIQGTTYYFSIWTADEVPNWSSLSNSATSQSQVPILSISITPMSYDFGGVNVATATVSINSITVTNDGNIGETYSLSLSTANVVWIPVENDPGAEEFLMNVAFDSDGEVIWNNYDHALSTATAPSTEMKFAGDQNGVDVGIGEERSLWMQFKSPLRTSTTDQQRITVIINAEQ